MLNNIEIGKYYPIDSKMHNLNPFIKFISILLIIIVAFFINNIICSLILLFISILNILMSNVPIIKYIKNILSMKVLLIFIIIINIIFKNQIYNILLIIFQLIIIILNTSLLMFTTKQNDLTIVLEKLLFPLKLFKINNRKIALMLSLALRFIPDILLLSDKMIKSQAGRGIDYYNGSFKEKIMALKAMLIPLIINSVRKSNMIADVMEIRLYDVNSKINFKKKKLVFYDYYYLILNSMIMLMLVVKGVII